ncbi:MAG: LD-carboxypeptidase [Deltaproteobacteria bacterium]|nr:LD-carboxypeptidase [Deltaproteobacteria bacterium]
MRTSDLTEPRTAFVVQPASLGTKVSFHRLEAFFKQKGIQVINTPKFKRKHPYMAGEDIERYRELLSAFSSSADIVVCLRGGYGSQRLLPLFNKRIGNKLFLGYSDITALQVTRVVPFAVYGDWTWLKSAKAWEIFLKIFNRSSFTVKLNNPSIKKPLKGVSLAANLSIFTDLLGTTFLKEVPEKFILFLEDTNEPLYRLDRMFFQLVNSKFLKNCVGLGLGNFDYQERLFSSQRLKTILDSLAINLPTFYYPVGHRGKGLLPVPQWWHVTVDSKEINFRPPEGI